MWKKKAAIVTLIISVVLVTLIAAIHSGFFRKWILSRVSAALSSADSRFSAASLDYDLRNLRFTLTDVRYVTRGIDVQIDRALVDLPWERPGRDPIRLSEVDLAGVRVRIDTQSTTGVSENRPDQPFDLSGLRIDRARIRDGTLSIVRPEQPTVEIPAFSLDLEGNAGTVVLTRPILGIQPELSVQINALPIRIAARSVEFGPANWRAEHPKLAVDGGVEGTLEWTPQVIVKARWDSKPSDLIGWKGVFTSGIVSYSEGVLQLDELTASAGRSQVTGTASLRPETNSVSLAWTTLDLSPLNVPAESTGSLDVTWSDPGFMDASGSGRVRVVSTQYGRASSSVLISGRRAVLGVDATGFNARVRADLVATLDQSISGRFRAEYPDYNAVARGTVRGSISDPRIAATLAVEKAAIAGLPPIDATAEVDGNVRGIAARNISLRMRDSVAVGEASLVLDGMRIGGAFPKVDMRIADFVPDVSGSLDLSATLSGTITEPRLEFSGSADQPIEIRRTRLESVEVAGGLSGDILRIDKVLATGPSDQKVEATGTVNLETHTVFGNIELVDLRLDRFPEADGKVSAKVSVDGTYDKPKLMFNGVASQLAFRQEALGDFTFDGALEGPDMRVSATSKKYSSAIQANIRPESPYRFDAKVTASEGLVTYRDYSATINGELGLSGQLQPFGLADLTAGNFRLNAEGARLQANGRLSERIEVAAAADLAKLPIEGVALTGSAAANVKVSGSLSDPVIEGRLSAEKATVFSEAMRRPATIDLVADFNRTEIVIDTLRAQWGSAIAQVKGRGNTRGLGAYEFAIENIRPEELFMDLPASGAIDLSGTARVKALEISGIEAQASLTSRSLQISGVPLRQTRSAMLHLVNGTVELAELDVEGGRTRLTISGSAGLSHPALDFTATGTTDLEVLEGFVQNTQIAGTAKTDIRVRGQPSNPEVDGAMELSDVEIRRQNPAIIATGGSGTVELKGSTARFIRISADVNDGILTAGGTVALSGGGVSETMLDVAAENVRWQYPDGLQAEVSANLQLIVTGSDRLISGEVRVTQAVYGRDVDISQEVFRRITTRTGPSAATLPESSLLDRARLAIDVRIPGEVLVVNNLANLQLAGNFRLSGTLGEPVITGRLQSLEGGEIYFGPSTGTSRTGRDAYTVEQGLIDLVNPRETEPEFDFVAYREVKDSKDDVYQVRLRVTGKIGDLKTDFTSEPPLSEPNIIALVLTGYTVDQAFGNELTLARNQALGYLSGVIQRSDLLEGTGRRLGLDSVRIDPFLIANETDLGARLTVGKDITRDFSLIFSQGLSGSQGQTWIAQYNAFKGFHLRGINDSVDNEVRAELQHQIDFGGPQRPVAPRHIFQTRRLGEVVIDQSSFSERELLNLVTKPGKPFSAFELQSDIEKLERFFVAQGYLNVQIRGQRQYRGDDAVDVTYRIQPGSQVLLEFAGMRVPDSVQRDLRAGWNSGLFEEQTIANARLGLMRYLADELYFQPDITVERSDTSAGAVVYRFVVNAGPRFSRPQWVFRGADPMPIEAGPREVVYSGEVVRGRIASHYRSLGYIDVQVEGPSLELKGQQAFYIVSVLLGEQYRVEDLAFRGNVFLKTDELQRAARSASVETLITDPWIRSASRAVEAAYGRQGFNNVEVKASLDAVPGAGRANVVFDIVEGPRQMISEIRIEGDQRSDRRFIRSLLLFDTGDPVDHERINQSRKRLYDTGMFRTVDIAIEPDTNDRFDARITVQENAPWRFRYGLTFADRLQVDRREIGLSTDLTYSNLFGRGATAGTSFRYDAATREIRLFSGLPTLIGRDVRTNFSVFGKRDLSDEFFIADEIGFSVQQQWQMRNSFTLSYDYNYRRNRTYERNLDPDNPFAFDLRIPVARFNASVTRDTRDDILNATRGTFLSNSFELAPPGVGSGIRFVKNYAQLFSFWPIGERLTWASGFRAGLGAAFVGEQLIPTEQFAAGGSTTVRGFKQNQLTRERGNAALILNQELRFPVAWWFSGAAFLDAGNIYPSVTNFNPFKLRYSPGLGVRLQTPFVLIRFDAGFNTARRPGEDRYRFSFGIGQAF